MAITVNTVDILSATQVRLNVSGVTSQHTYKISANNVKSVSEVEIDPVHNSITNASLPNKYVLTYGNYSANYDAFCYDGVSWLDKAPATSPVAFRRAALAYDSARKVVVLFGGESADSVRNETYEWDGTDWTLVSPVASPPARSRCAMAYDSNRGVIVMYGGVTWAEAAVLNDTWEYNGTTWTEKATGGVTKPGYRYSHALAFDSSRNVVVFYGGLYGTSKNDTWEWNGTAWSEIAPVASPSSARYGHCLAYDANRNVSVMFGGFDGTNAKNDTWEYNGTTWAEKATGAVTKPDARARHALAYDVSRTIIVLSGGYNENELESYDDTWEWNGADWVEKTPIIKYTNKVDVAMSYFSI